MYILKYIHIYRNITLESDFKQEMSTFDIDIVKNTPFSIRILFYVIAILLRYLHLSSVI